MLAAAVGVAGLAGCQGNGVHTSAQISAAQQKWSVIKSATEWDMARQAYLAGNLDKALKRVDRSLAMNGSVAKSHVLRGRILIEKGDLEAAIDAFLKAEAIDPDNTQAQYYLGIIYERFSQPERALTRYRKAGELDTSDPQFAIAAAEMMIQMGRLDEAEDYLQSRRPTFEYNAGIRQTLGHIALIKGDAPRAARLFGEARLLAPDDEAIVEDLTRAQMATDQFAKAEYNISALLAKPENANRRDLLHMRARCLVELDRPVEARDVLLSLTSGREGAGDVQAWIQLGNIAHKLNDRKRLRAAAQRVIAQAPQRPEGYVLLATWRRESGDLAGAITSLNEAIRLSPGDARPILLRGLVEEEMADYAKAAQTYAFAAAMSPEQADSLYRLRDAAMAHVAAGALSAEQDTSE